jgi:hypothetical protein
VGVGKNIDCKGLTREIVVRWNENGGRGVHPPTNLHEYRNKEVTGIAFCKRLKIKRLFDGKNGVYSVD